MRDAQGRVKRLWCTVMHPAPMWPVGGYYRCPKCLHRYPVPWEGKQPAGAAKPKQKTRTRIALPAWTGIRVWRGVFGH